MFNSQMTRTEKIRYCAIMRWIIYILMIFVSVVIMNTGSGNKPIILIPLCICICMNEGEYTSAFLGGICGLLLDFSFDRIFGYSSALMIVICVTSVLLFKHYLIQNIFNIIWLSALFSAFYQFIDYFFMYGMWNYDGAEYVLKNISLPTILYTTIISPIIWLFIKPVLKRFYPKRAKNIEEAMKI